MTTSAAVTVDVHLEDGDRTDSLHRDARAGLARRAKDLSPIWLYDERGCQL